MIDVMLRVFVIGLYLIVSFTLVSVCTSCKFLTHTYTSDKEMTYKCTRYGVEYVQTVKGLALHVDRENKPVMCE